MDLGHQVLPQIYRWMQRSSEEEETTQPLLDDEANQVVSVEQRSFSSEQQLAEVPAEVPKPLPEPFISLPQVRIPETRSLPPRGSRVIPRVPQTSRPNEAHEGVREEEELVSVVSTGQGRSGPDPCSGDEPQ